MTVIGDYVETKGAMKVLLLKLSNADLMKAWKRCSITADYGANYITFTYPGCREMENSASMILNELLENAAKYSQGEGENIEIEILINNDTIVFRVDNELDEKQYQLFKDFVNGLAGCKDVNDLYMKKLTKFVENNNNDSGIGLLTLITYYNPRMGYKFQHYDKDNHYRVSVQAALPLGSVTCI